MEYTERTTMTFKVESNTTTDEDLRIFEDSIMSYLELTCFPERQVIVTLQGADRKPRFNATAANRALENTFGTVGFELIREAAKTKKITAIRLVRRELGCGLTEAKDLVERWRFYAA